MEGARAQLQSSKRGCITCRIRRVKCDETRPSCTRCSKSQRKCDGYLITPYQPSRRTLATAVRNLNVIGPIGRAMPLSTTYLPTDISYYDCFRQKTVKSTTRLFASNYLRLVLVIAEIEPAMWNIAVALGAMHRACEIRAQCAAEEKWHRNFATGHYVQAISEAKKLREPRVLLVASVVFAALTGLMGWFQDRGMHVSAGFRLLREEQARLSDKFTDEDLEAIADSLARVEIQDTTLAASTLLHPTIHPNYRMSDLNAFNPQGDFQSAERYLTKLLRGFLSARYACSTGRLSRDDFLYSRQRVTVALFTWEIKMLGLLEEKQPKGKAVKKSQDVISGARILTIKIIHAFLLLCLEGPAFSETSSADLLVEGDETAWDGCLPLFERIVALIAGFDIEGKEAAPGFSMSLEPGLGLPLDLICKRCRHPLVRRHALRLLKGMDSQEGVWKSSAAIVVIEQWITLEEQNLHLDLPLYPDYEALGALVDPSMERPEYWLRGNTNFECLSTWEIWPKIPEADRIVARRLIPSLDDNTMELSFYTRKPQSSDFNVRHHITLRF